MAVLAGGLLAVILVAWIVLFSPLLALKSDQIAVEGATESLSADQVKAVIAPYVGTPLTRLNTGTVESAVAALPLAKDVSVHFDWPDGLTVQMSVRTPALRESTGSGEQVVDDQGAVLPTDGTVPDGLPLVSLPQDSAARTRAAGQAATVWASLSEELRGQVVSMAGDGDQMTLTLKDNRTVKWGSEEDSDLKAQVLGVLLAQRPAQVYDVSVPSRPVTS